MQRKPRPASPTIYCQLVQFLTPLLQTLDRCLDVRLVRAFLASLGAIVQWRNQPHGLLLSKLGAYLLMPARAPAATKCLSNLLRSPRWTADLLTHSAPFSKRKNFVADKRAWRIVYVVGAAQQDSVDVAHHPQIRLAV